MPTPEWTLRLGDEIQRTELQATYGGRTQGGIAPSRKSPNVLLFSDPVAGEPHGYYDGWRTGGWFDYTGEGQRGDQRLHFRDVAGVRVHVDMDHHLVVDLQVVRLLPGADHDPGRPDMAGDLDGDVEGAAQRHGLPVLEILGELAAF